jgi:aerobic-type carbon monoxide dehydrogenase small subunit (CoxS/CutS family)
MFREVNERIEAGQWPAERDELVAFRCKCGSLRCNMLVELTLADYEHVRANATHFVLVAGHEIPTIERVVERETAYVVVEKVGRAGEIAEQTDPRDD